METQVVTHKKGQFFGWRVIYGCMLSYSAVASIGWIFTMTFPQLQKEFGWTATDLGLILALGTWLGVLWAIVGGWICDRVGNRWFIIIFSIVAGASVLMYTVVTQIWQMYIFYPILVSFASQTVMMIGVLSLPRKWFLKRAALASGLIGGFWGLVSSIVFPLVSSLATNIGWRHTIFIIVPTLTFIAVLAAVLLIRDTPEKMGLTMDGIPVTKVEPITGMTRGEAIRTPQFWLLAIIWGVSAADFGAVQGNITLMAVNYGIPAAAAGTAMTVMMVPAIFSRIGIGPLGDRFGKKRMLWVSSAICTAFFLGGSLFVHNPISLYVFLGLLGLVMMAGITLIPPLWGDLFGRKNLAGIMGIGTAIGVIVAGLITLTIGLLRTVTGYYNLGFLFLGIMFGVQVVLLFILRPTKFETTNMAGKNI